jgi:putative MATE family efflux protein
VLFIKHIKYYEGVKLDNADKLGTDRIGKLLVEYSFPAIIGMLVSGCYNIIDRIFIGHSIGNLGIAAVTVAFPIMTIQMALAGLVGMGATANISIKLGQGDKITAQRISGNTVTLLAIISVLFTAFGLIFLEPMLSIFGASPDVMPYAKEYMSIILLGTVFQCYSFGMNNMMRAEGKPVISMVTMLIGTALNVVLAPLFIFVFHWGMLGAALATVFSQAVSAIWIFLHFVSGKSLLRIGMKNLILDREIVKQITLLGMPMFFIQSAQCVQTAVMNNGLALYGGDVAISGMGIVTSITTLILMPIFGINQGSQPIIGYNYGAGKLNRVKKTFFRAVIAATSVSAAGFIMTRVIPHQLISMFDSSDSKLIEFGAYALSIYLMCFFVVGFQIAGSNYFQAVGKPKVSMLLSLSRQILILIPLLIVLPHFLKINGILIAGPIADFSSFVITSVCIILEMRKIGREEQHTVPAIKSD